MKRIEHLNLKDIEDLRWKPLEVEEGTAINYNFTKETFKNAKKHLISLYKDSKGNIKNSFVMKILVLNEIYGKGFEKVDKNKKIEEDSNLM